MLFITPPLIDYFACIEAYPECSCRGVLATVGDVRLLLKSVALGGLLLFVLPCGALLLGNSVVTASNFVGVGGEATVGAMTGQAVPGPWLVAEVAAATACPPLPWFVLASFGFVASRSGRFEDMPPPWASTPEGSFGLGQSSNDLNTEAENAVAILCKALSKATTLHDALLSVTSSPKETSVLEVVATALSVAPLLAAGRAQAILFAASALGLPYQWGGNGPTSYDCSGLMVASWRSAGVVLPRTAQEQYDATQRMAGHPAPGDLIFFGATASKVTHVGMEIGDGLLIDAPYTGAFVRIDPDDLSGSVGTGRVT